MRLGLVQPHHLTRRHKLRRQLGARPQAVQLPPRIHPIAAAVVEQIGAPGKVAPGEGQVRARVSVVERARVGARDCGERQLRLSKRCYC